MDENLTKGRFDFPSSLGKAVIASAAVAAASVLGASVGRHILDQVYNRKDDQKSKSFGFSRH